ncbi:SDR family NAD(P)-dependent oxidoreductase [Bacillus taeanensis]|uniref:SDR family NAD(P)-dependent oxidoreductase n=1 Tax=Bacillus taeanensis TaxID=273032 RepID=A0A366Y0T8_9BACI|nr:SDR family oxidoreductase [Bacillus taeanensis]RBW69791.1 SDR family NAD(P)-dependent oxidoreductase [Bacillus taeanensis]
MVDLQNKVVIVTGAGSGLGKETAIVLAKAGAKVAICGRRTHKLAAVEEIISASGQGEVLAVTADVSVESEVKMFIQAVLEKFGRIDVLINNAAVFQQYDAVDMSLDTWNFHIDNNVTSVFLMMRESLSIMREQKSGKIINITSGLAREGAAGFGAYSASKAAVESLTYSVDDEEYKNSIAAHVFNPGVMKTELQSFGDDPTYAAGKLAAFIKSNMPSKKRPVYLEEIEDEEKAVVK